MPHTNSKDVAYEPAFLCHATDFSRVDKRVVSKRVVLADVPPERKPERGYIRMFPRNDNRNEGTFACSPRTKTGMRVHSPKPPFYETALLSPSDLCARLRPCIGAPHLRSFVFICVFLRPTAFRKTAVGNSRNSVTFNHGQSVSISFRQPDSVKNGVIH